MDDITSAKSLASDGIPQLFPFTPLELGRSIGIEREDVQGTLGGNIILKSKQTGKAVCQRS
jgi:hypothetical protein